MLGKEITAGADTHDGGFLSKIHGALDLAG